jgi:hypothetical protein
MTYNADGSEYYNIAANLKKIFEERYAKMVREADGEYMSIAIECCLFIWLILIM